MLHAVANIIGASPDSEAVVLHFRRYGGKGMGGADSRYYTRAFSPNRLMEYPHTSGVMARIWVSVSQSFLFLCMNH